jgi:hypothetical protein
MTNPTPEPLFAVKDTEPKRCNSCGTTRASLCVHDANIAHGLVSRTLKRPRSCLNSYQPDTAEIPY